MPLPKPRSNSLFSNSAFIFIIRFFPSVANLVVLIYYSRHLDKTIYGEYQNFWTQLNFIYPIACIGIQSLITTYSPAAITKLLRGLSSRQYALYSLWLILFGMCFAWIQPSVLHIGFFIPLLFMITFALGVIAEAFLIVFKNFKSIAFINLFYALLYLAIHKLVLDSGYSHYYLFLSLLMLNVLRLAAAMIIASRDIRHTIGDVELRPISEIRTLWLHLGSYDIIQTLSGWIDKFLVSILLTASLSAIYINGTQNIPFLPQILSASGSAVLIQMTHVNAADEKESLRHLMNLSARYLSNIVFPLFFFLIFFRYELYSVVLPGYEAAVPIFLVSLFMLPFKTYSFITVFQKLHKGHIGNIGAIGELILASLLMYPLYKWLGLPGIMLSFIISSYLQGAFYFYHMARLMNTTPYHLVPVVNWAIKIIIYSTLFLLLHYLVTSFFDANVSLIIGIVVMVITVLASLLIELRLRKNVGNTQKTDH